MPFRSFNQAQKSGIILIRGFLPRRIVDFFGISGSNFSGVRKMTK